MPNKKHKIPKKPTKRVLSCGGWSYVDSESSDKCCMDIKYIIDRGNLIQDVRTVYKETVYFKNPETLEQHRQRYIKSGEKIKHDLEYQIYATGATRYNAEFTAQKILANCYVGKTK